MRNKNLVLIGYGYWGKKILATLQNVTQEPITIFDKVVSPNITSIEGLDLYLSQLKKPHFFFIATPEETHFSLVKKLLQWKQHVFVEKPLSLTKVEADELIEIAKKNNLNLFVDRIFLYDQGYQLVKKLITENRIGKINKIESIRHSEHIHKPDISVSDDLAPHDIYLIHDLFHTYPKDQRIHILQKNAQQITEAKVIWKTQDIEWTNWYSWNTRPTVRRMKVIGDKGEIIWKKNAPQDEVIVKMNNLEKKYVIAKQPSTLGQVIQDFFDTTNQETDSQRNIRYQEYIDEVAMLESIRVQSSSL